MSAPRPKPPNSPPSPRAANPSRSYYANDRLKKNKNLCVEPVAGGCFPGSSMVTLASGGRVALRALRVGDAVEVAKPDGSRGFEPVVFFDHQVDGDTATFVRLALADGSALELTPGHFIPVGASLAKAVYARAAAVKAGDLVLVLPAGADSATPVAVEAVASVTRAGLFAPVTTSGVIVVDGVVASTYSDWVLDGLFDFLGMPNKLHAAYHIVHAPHRALFAAFGPKLMTFLTPILSGIGMLDARQLAAAFTPLSA